MTQPEPIPGLADIRAAGDAIAGAVLKTPLVPSAALSAKVRQEILLKLELLQSTGAFKLRGATNAIQRLSDEQRKRGVGCCSTGNHGRAIAAAAARLGVRAVVA